MSEVRPIDASDVPVVASLFQRIFRDPKRAAPPSLAEYLRDFYFEGPWAHPEIRPLVHVDDDGRVNGFIGVHTLPMRFGARELTAAFCGSLMVADRSATPLAGARLLKRFVAGPQDVSFSETVNDISLKMWTQLGGVSLPSYSLTWLRALRPAGFATALAARRFPAIRLLDPMMRGLDALYWRRRGVITSEWAGFHPKTPLAGGYRLTEIDADGFARALRRSTAHYELAPTWSKIIVDAQLRDAMSESVHGAPVLAEVTSRSGEPAGAFFYYVRPGDIARVLQVLAAPGKEGIVLDHLISDAARRGAAGIAGRSQPALMSALIMRRVAFIPHSVTAAYTGDPAVAEAFSTGRAFVNGFAGESWSRLVNGVFV